MRQKISKKQLLRENYSGTQHPLEYMYSVFKTPHISCHLMPHAARCVDPRKPAGGFDLPSAFRDACHSHPLRPAAPTTSAGRSRDSKVLAQDDLVSPGLAAQAEHQQLPAGGSLPLSVSLSRSRAAPRKLMQRAQDNAMG